jgi:hypothetical protein
MNVALARSIDAFISSLCQSPSVSLVQPVITGEEPEAENGSAEERVELGDPGSVDLVGDPYAGGLKGEDPPELPIVW